ncbi:MAG: 2Fe-2S iron-sulfur cluster-binding protein, partial [Arenicellales bacterium]
MAEPRSQFRCLLGGQELTVTSFDPQLTLLDFLRLHQGLTGTKEGCAEGDCGACTVLIGRLSDQALHYYAVNACIVPLGSVDSAQILTVEHIADPEPHPVQHALARCHGSQCGFCTPGIAMSLAGLHEACASGRSSADRRTINDTLAGNLCRCTGYGPIISAAEQACTEDRPDHLESLRAVAETTLSRWAGDEQYLCSEGAAGGFAAPTDLAACWSVQKRLADAQLIAGSTDVGLWINKEHRCFSNVID